MSPMSATSHDRRAGMTLIELLVVISILGLLAVTVLPNLSNTGDRRKVREAARAVSGFIAGGQSRALGSRSGGGLWIDPLSNQIASDTLSMVAAIDLAAADVPQPYSGNATTSTITTLNPTTGAQTVATFSEACGPLVSGTNLIRLVLCCEITTCAYNIKCTVFLSSSIIKTRFKTKLLNTYV